MRKSIKKTFASLAAIAALLESGVPAEAQSGQPAIYAAVAAGAAAEPSQFNVRSALGFSFAVGAGRFLSPRAALEVRAGGEYFGAPTEFISPGGCLGRLPCNPPQPSAVKVVTLASDAVISKRARSTGPMLLIGLGARHIAESPERSADVRPFVEIGGAIAQAIGTRSLALELRYQVTTSGTDLPRWTMPIALVARFF